MKRYTTTAIAVAAVAAAALVYSPSGYSCGLEPGINGGITISYPGSIDVAVAVADARTKGLLPAASTDAITNEVRLQNMLADLRRLQTRLNAARNDMQVENAASFSLVLVGPGLWSHYSMTNGGVLTSYHTDGPLAGKTVVLTHAAALRAMLVGNLSIERATELGLIAYSGIDTAPIQRTFEISL
ncbi:MAG: hypothetical protein HKO86_03115 [Gammaproteobacteria bacterium]|nr:hypothetical protein [Gammaproteobacteria bacterium]NNL06689.1 hypothetical protein [Gammaproteobacteria bacterium]